MLHATGTLPGYDRTPLFFRTWTPSEAGAAPPGGPRGTVVFVHGYGDHSDRYDALARHLTPRGLRFCAYDQRGYGRSGGPTAFVHSFDEYVADLHGVVRHVRSRLAGGPLFLMGHSMGGAVALLYCLDHGAAPRGLVLSSPMLRLPAPKFLQSASGLLGRLAPALPTVPLERDAVSRDPSVVEDALDDPRCYNGLIKARTGAEMVRATRRLDGPLARRLTVPLLLFHGTADRLTDPGGSRALYDRARSADKTLNLYDDFYHETFHDPGGERVLQDVAGWIEARAAAETSGRQHEASESKN